MRHVFYIREGGIHFFSGACLRNKGACFRNDFLTIDSSDASDKCDEILCEELDLFTLPLLLIHKISNARVIWIKLPSILSKLMVCLKAR